MKLYDPWHEPSDRYDKRGYKTQSRESCRRTKMKLRYPTKQALEIKRKHTLETLEIIEGLLKNAD